MAQIKPITLSGTKIWPGETVSINFNVATLPTHTPVDLPVYVFRSDKPGPTLLLTAGLHGDELNGIETLRRMIRDKMLMPESGSVIAIPIINIFGFLHHSRDLPDGKDLNRVFPGSKKGSLGSVIAWTMMNEILPQVNLGVDFHTGGAQIDNFPQVRCAFEHPENLAMAKKFGAPFIINSKFIDKSFRKEAFKQKKQIIVFEGGESFRFDETSILEGIAGVQRLMHALEMKEGRIPHADPIIFSETHWVRAKMSGLFRKRVQRGDSVKKGQVLAVLSDPYGEMEFRVVAPYSGYIVGVNHKPVVNLGDAMFNLGITG